MILQDLQEEYERDLVGSLIYERTRNLIDRFLRHRDPRIYAGGAYDYRDSIEDVLNDFVLEVLIGERQIDYVMSVAEDLADYDRLVQRHIRRYLARTRNRTVVDNLIDRSIPILRSDPFSVVSEAGGSEGFGMADRDYSVTGVATDDELRRAAALSQAIPKVRSEATERAPKVYTAEHLAAVLRILVETVSGPIDRSELQKFFDLILTAWTPSFLDTDEGAISDVDEGPEEATLVNDTAQRILEEMSAEEMIIFQYKHANLPDRELAAHLGLSRQSTAPRKAALFARIEAEIADLEPRTRARVLYHVSLKIAENASEK